MNTTQGETPLDRLVDLLDLETIEVDIFRGKQPDESLQRVFGGQVAGQALVAAGRTVPADRPVHSLHAYFLRPGDPSIPIVYQVDRIRDGRSFTTRRVVAVQHGKAIFHLSASFQVAEPGPGHVATMPDVPGPEGLTTLSERMQPYAHENDGWYTRPRPIDADLYRWRHLIENFFGKLKDFKRIALRACKTDDSFAAMIYAAAAIINSQ